MPLEEMLSGVQLIKLEEFAKHITPREKLITLVWVRLLPAWLLHKLFITPVTPEACAVVLFSSGSEGAPKGVQISHKIYWPTSNKLPTY